MQSTTRKLAVRVQQALLALSDETLSETLSHWIGTIKDRYEDPEILAWYSETLCYQVTSIQSGQTYESLEALDLAEPEAGEICWRAPAPSHLREIIGKKQASQVYHQLIALAGEALRQADFATLWPEPPDPEERRNGYAFMQCLERYLILRRDVGCTTTDQFEAQYTEQLAVIAESFPEPEWETFQNLPGVFANEHAVHFHVVFTEADAHQQAALHQTLQQYDFLFLPSEQANSLEGRVFYNPGRKTDLKQLQRVRRLLTRWQQAERITVEEQKEHPPKRRLSKEHPQKKRRKK